MTTLTAQQGFRLDWRGSEIASMVRRTARTAMDDTLDAAVKRAKQLAPVDTGRLRNSIRKERLSETYNGMKGEISANTTYALYVELGTVKMRAQPYLRPAMDAEFRKFPKTLADRVQRLGGF